MSHRVEKADVCIIGSGAGGAVAAYELAKRGLSVIVVERGPRVGPGDFTNDELSMVPRLYKDGGMQLNTSMDLFIMQGNCVGGSTVISNMVMLRPQSSVFEQWARYGAELDKGRLGRCFDEVANELNISHPPSSNVSESSLRFLCGARSLGYEPEFMLKALGSCKGCGYCNVGCTFGTKRDASTTYVRWAEEAGARIIPETEVLRIHHKGGLARWLDARHGRQKESLRVDADIVVVSAGAIGSSALLLRSGITRNVGRRLSFNAGAMVVADFDEPLDAYDADQMTICLRGAGFVIEATHNPPMSAALTTPGWLSQHGELMARFRHLGYAGTLVPTESSGRVVMSPFFGHEETRFRMSSADLKTLKRGMRTAAEIYFEAGARRIVLPTHRYKELASPKQLEAVKNSFHHSHEITMGSAHPQGGNAISSDPRLGVVDERLRVHDFENLFVCDASVFPSGIGINPIHTIMAVAKFAAPAIAGQA